MTKIYLDACCLNRLTDDQAQHRIREEAEAVELILRGMQSGEVQWISSEALTDEINRAGAHCARVARYFAARLSGPDSAFPGRDGVHGTLLFWTTEMSAVGLTTLRNKRCHKMAGNVSNLRNTSASTASISPAMLLSYEAEQ